jgi:O-antigen ligase
LSGRILRPRIGAPSVARQARSRGAAFPAVGAVQDNEPQLKLLICAIFLPEGLSFFIGDFRLSVARVLIFVFAIMALSQRGDVRSKVNVPSDSMALITGAWMMIAATFTDGFTGLKGAGMDAITFSGTYLIFRYMLGPVNSSVRLMYFACKVVLVVIAVAMLDPFTGRLATYDFIKGLTGYSKPAYESALVLQAETLFRDGTIRAMGPLEHSILFGAVCAWFGTAALVTFKNEIFGWVMAIIALVAILFSQAKSPLLAFGIGALLAGYYSITPRFTSRWKLAGLSVTALLVTVFTFSGSPIATLVRLVGVSPESAWYRQAIWDVGMPVVLGSPLFGIGIHGDWDWQSHGALVSGSVDAFWLAFAMSYGIPGSLLVLATIVGACMLGSVDKSPYLTREEGRLSAALGIGVAMTVVLGFIVHFWGICWILIAALAGIRAHLAEAAIVRGRAAQVSNAACEAAALGLPKSGRGCTRARSMRAPTAGRTSDGR